MLREDADDRCSISTFGGTSPRPGHAPSTETNQVWWTACAPRDLRRAERPLDHPHDASGVFDADLGRGGHCGERRIRWNALAVRWVLNSREESGEPLIQARRRSPSV
jgi:hypothetical protein